MVSQPGQASERCLSTCKKVLCRFTWPRYVHLSRRLEWLLSARQGTLTPGPPVSFSENGFPVMEYKGVLQVLCEERTSRDLGSCNPWFAGHTVVSCQFFRRKFNSTLAWPLPNWKRSCVSVSSLLYERHCLRFENTSKVNGTINQKLK